MMVKPIGISFFQGVSHFQVNQPFVLGGFFIHPAGDWHLGLDQVIGPAGRFDSHRFGQIIVGPSHGSLTVNHQKARTISGI